MREVMSNPSGNRYDSIYDDDDQDIRSVVGMIFILFVLEKHK